MEEQKDLKKYLKENPKIPFVESIKDGILYTVSLMIVITLFSRFNYGVYIVDAKLVFVDYAIYGIAVCIIHYISDKIAIYITSNMILNSIKEKKQLSGRMFLLPYAIEITFDYLLAVLFVFFSVNVMFEILMMPLVLVFIIRIINKLVDSLLKLFVNRGENYD